MPRGRRAIHRVLIRSEGCPAPMNQHAALKANPDAKRAALLSELKAKYLTQG